MAFYRVTFETPDIARLIADRIDDKGFTAIADVHDEAAGWVNVADSNGSHVDITLDNGQTFSLEVRETTGE